jgi:hypothetical protein
MAAAVVAVSFATTAGPANAQPPNAGKKGPQASVSAVSVCAISGSDLTVEIRLSDKTSGEAIPGLDGYSIDALVKNNVGNWSNQEIFDDANAGGLNMAALPPSVGPIPFSLCRPEIIGDPDEFGDEAKGLNASVSVTYGYVDAYGNIVDASLRTIVNMCSDDTATDTVEPSGIKLTDSIIMEIQSACLNKLLDNTGLTDATTTTTEMMTTTDTTDTTSITTTESLTTETTTTDAGASTTTTTDPTTTSTTGL